MSRNLRAVFVGRDPQSSEIFVRVIKSSMTGSSGALSSRPSSMMHPSGEAHVGPLAQSKSSKPLGMRL
eukprot:scaffold117661_cov36-Prasinocladus_malaysianus.AAC.2